MNYGLGKVFKFIIEFPFGRNHVKCLEGRNGSVPQDQVSGPSSSATPPAARPFLIGGALSLEPQAIRENHDVFATAVQEVEKSMAVPEKPKFYL